MTPSMMKDLASFLSPQIGTVPAASAAGTVNGTGIDRVNPGAGVGMALCADLIAVTGAVTGGPATQTLDAKIQDSADNASFADYKPDGVTVAAIAQITTVNTLGRKRVDLSNARRYIRVVTTVGLTGGASPTLANQVTVELGGLQNPPTT